jgi:hypothetical protein
MRSKVSKEMMSIGGAAGAPRQRWRRARVVSGVALVAALTMSASAFAVDGCEVLLCLAAPNGWKTISQCVPPMEQLLKSLATGHAFPSCSMAGAPPASKGNPQGGTGSYAVQMPANYYNQCPAGTTALPAGNFAVMAPNWVPADNTAAWIQQQTLYAGIGDGTGLSPASGAAASTLPPEVCVTGTPIGQVNYLTNFGGAGFGGILPMTVGVYTAVTILQPDTSPNIIGVYIDGALYNQVHW